MRTIVFSDIHLASGIDADLLRRPEMREPLLAAVEGADQVILLGDVIELRDRPLPEALELARPFFEDLTSIPGRRRTVVVPGNHDHHLLSGWLERRRLDGAGPLWLEHRARADEGPLAALMRGMPWERLELAYPGVWIRPDIYATHGHYLDRHLTVPTFERLAVAAVERILGPGPSGPDPLAPPEEEPATVIPDEYEAAQAPVYAFLFALAQAVGRDRAAAMNPSARIWTALGGGQSRAAKLRGWLLGSVALPGAVGVANRLGLGPVRSDLTPGTLTRAGLAAITEVVTSLGIDSEHVIFGHTHRRGPLEGETGWEVPGGPRLWNTGNWVYTPGLIGSSASRSPYWPGTIAVIEDKGPPRLQHLLDGFSREELAGAGGDPDSE